MIDFRLPTAEEEERARAFAVHMNYVSAIDLHLAEVYGGGHQSLLENLITVQRTRTGFQRIRERKVADRDSVRRYLLLSWSSELQLRLGSIGGDTMIRYSNVWAPIHAYYAAYMAAQAWFAVNRMSHLVDDHTKSLRSISSHITERGILPSPWSVTCGGCPPVDQPVFQGLPPGIDPYAHVEVLSTPTSETFWPRYCKMLEKTREKRLERNFAEWKRRFGRQRMWADEKREVAGNLVATTLADFLWRLRVRSNYRDVATFLTWNVSDEQHWRFRRALVSVTDATCALFESAVVAAGGRALYDNELEEFAAPLRDELPPIVNFWDMRRQAILGE